jgi:hypothetical protein
MTRRSLLQALSGGLALSAGRSLFAIEPVPKPTPAPGASDELLDRIVRGACRYFADMADPDTGLVLDRTTLDAAYEPGISSIAATGFGLSSLTIAAQWRYMDPEVARRRIRTTLDYLVHHAEHTRGFFYHFLNSATGKRAWQCEASSIDTAWLLCGALHCRATWQDADIRDLAGELLERADWKWMLHDSDTLSHGWRPEGGFLPYRWDRYSELLAMYLLAMSSERHAIPGSSWDAWHRPMRDYKGIWYIDDGTPLFVHQYSHAWFDFRGRADRYADYFTNSQRATQAHRRFCMDLASQFPWYGPDMWGVTASESRDGYRVWCSEAHPPDGTLVPCASGGSLVFLPDLCGTVLETMVERYGKQVWCKYGFVDAFHPQADWYSREVIGIDLGIMLLMAENERSQSVWEAVMSTPEASRGMERAGLRRV